MHQSAHGNASVASLSLCVMVHSDKVEYCMQAHMVGSFNEQCFDEFRSQPVGMQHMVQLDARPAQPAGIGHCSSSSEAHCGIMQSVTQQASETWMVEIGIEITTYDEVLSAMISWACRWGGIDGLG